MTILLLDSNLLEYIFRDEGKISRKLMDCVNTYLLKDGPNLGCRAKDIHAALQGFLFSFWLTTHDRGLKVLSYFSF